MNQVMIAFFSSTENQHKALAAAREARVRVGISGEGQLFVTPDSDGSPAKFIVFTAEAPIDALLFMANGASSCGPF